MNVAVYVDMSNNQTRVPYRDPDQFNCLPDHSRQFDRTTKKQSPDIPSKMALKSWLPVGDDSHFSLANIPLGIVSRRGSDIKYVATRVGDHVLNLSALARASGFAGSQGLQECLKDVLSQDCLNTFAALGRHVHRSFRAYLQDLLRKDTPYPGLLRDNSMLKQECLLTVDDVNVCLPMRIGDYTDFYAGKNHAYNVGVLFRGPQNALQPNYQHLPVAYHGRASSVVVSTTPIRRPCGQILLNPKDPQPVHAPSRKLDIELELAAFICKDNKLGEPVDLNDAPNYVFGYVLMNDWSARDIQAWEYVPLGPFNSKNFATTISPWVVLADAFETYRRSTLDAGRHTSLLPYLRGSGSLMNTHDISLSVELQVGNDCYTISRTNASNLSYSFEQMIAHHTVTGCALRVGDLLGSGTISGPDVKSCGSFLEISQNGETPLQLSSKSVGLQRTFLEDGDKIIIRGVTGQHGAYVGFGECEGVILPAHGASIQVQGTRDSEQ